jgi:hypothetical protein
MKFRKKPVIVEVWECNDLLFAAASDWKMMPKPIADAYEAGNILFLPNKIQIKTLEGWHDGDRTDFIVQGVKGELYPCKPDIFAMTYEEVVEKSHV